MNSLLILFNQIVELYIWILIINAVASWLVAFNVINTSNRFVYLILETTYRLTDLALRFIRRYTPNLGSVDISPVILILGLIFLRNFINEIFNKLVFQKMIIDGKKEAESLTKEIKKEISSLKKI